MPCEPVKMDPPNNSLLLLPSLASGTGRADFARAYRSTFQEVLKNVKPDSINSVAKLEVLLGLDETYDARRPRSSLFDQVQVLMATVYALFAAAAAKEDVELDMPGGVDVRVFAVTVPPFVTFDVKQTLSDYISGPLVHAYTFAQAQRKYDQWFHVDSPKGNELYRSLLNYWTLTGGLVVHSSVLPCTLASSKPDPQSIQTKSRMHTHKRIANGGTFDHLHIGHKLLLAGTFLLSEPGSGMRQITVGTTGDKLLVNKKHAGVLESWDVRQQRAADFVESVLVFHRDPTSLRTIQKFDEPGPNGKVVRVSYQNPANPDDVIRINYTELSDPYGPPITDESITAIVLTAETSAGGKGINDKRSEKGWEILEVFEVDILDADDALEDSKVPKTSFEGKISSTAIRQRLAAGKSS